METPDDFFDNHDDCDKIVLLNNELLEWVGTKIGSATPFQVISALLFIAGRLGELHMISGDFDDFSKNVLKIGRESAIVAIKNEFHKQNKKGE